LENWLKQKSAVKFTAQRRRGADEMNETSDDMKRAIPKWHEITLDYDKVIVTPRKGLAGGRKGCKV
jgi:hypothetical protein